MAQVDSKFSLDMEMRSWLAKGHDGRAGGRSSHRRE